MVRNHDDPKCYTWTSRQPGQGTRENRITKNAHFVTQGVWVIDHDPTGLWMIGQSRTVSAEVDKQLKLLAAGRHPNKRFQKMYNFDPDIKLLEYPSASAAESKRFEAILRANNTGSMTLCT